MLCKNSFIVNILNICAASFVALLSLSCTATVHEGQQTFSSQFLAEHSMMRKRLPLIERESDVLKTENQQYRAKIYDLEKENKQLGQTLTSLKEKYADDMALGAEAIDTLQETMQKIEHENSDSIAVLVSENRGLEEKLARDIQALNEKIEIQKEVCSQEREQLVQENAQKELKWSTELGMLKKELEPKNVQISSLKLAISEISIQLGAATSLSDTLKKSRDEYSAELESIKAANEDLNKKLAVLGSVKAANVDLNKKIAELELIKTANVDLNIKLAELSSQLSRQNSLVKNTP